MGFRSGPDNPRSGPRLPIDSDEFDEDEPVSVGPIIKRHKCPSCGYVHGRERAIPMADSAHGERVRRCRECGTAEPEDGLFQFGLVLHGKPVGRYMLCGRCFRNSNPIDPRLGDPLQVA